LKKTVAIAGATGFIGKWFIDKYKNDFRKGKHSNFYNNE